MTRTTPSLPRVPFPVPPQRSAGARPGRRPVGAVPLRVGGRTTAGTRLGNCQRPKPSCFHAGGEHGGEDGPYDAVAPPESLTPFHSRTRQERDSDAVRSEPFHCGRGAAPPLALDSETARGPSRDAPRGQRARRRGRPARRRRSPALPPFFPRPTAGARPGRRPVGAVPLRAGSLPTAGTRLGSVALNKSTYSRGGREVVTAGVPGLGRSGPLLGRTRGAYI